MYGKNYTVLTKKITYRKSTFVRHNQVANVYIVWLSVVTFYWHTKLCYGNYDTYTK